MTIAIIFDWDDTLFPSSYYNDKRNYATFIKSVNLLETSIISILNKSQLCKNVYIMTNASMIWLNYCLDNYMPKLKLYLRIIAGIISSRDMYSQKYPNDIVLWKTLSMIDLLKENPRITSIIFISDLVIDFQSLHKIKYIMPNINTKTYKFIEQPTMCQIIKQQIEFETYLNKLFQL